MSPVPACLQKLRRSLEVKNGSADLAAELAPVTAVTDKSLQAGRIVTDSTLGGSAQP